MHREHLPDRFALFVIVSLGELLTAGVAAVHDTAWATVPLLVSLCGFVVAACLWWAYFDIAAEPPDGDPDGDDDPDSDGSEGTGRHDRFVYGHLPFTGGLIAAGAAFEHLAVHAGEPTGTAGVILGIGLTACLAGLAVVTAGTTRSWRMTWPWPVAGIPLIAVVAALHLPALTLAVVTAAVVAAVAGLGTVRRRVRPPR